MGKRNLYLVGLIFALTIFVLPAAVKAHTPGPVTLTYDFASQELTVVVSHSVPDVNSHYIIQVNVDKNSADFLTRDYTSQNTTSQFSAVYSIPAVHGDVLSVQAICSVSGSATNQVTVIDPAHTDTTTTDGGITPIDTTLIIAVVIVVIGIAGVIVAILKRR